MSEKKEKFDEYNVEKTLAVYLQAIQYKNDINKFIKHIIMHRKYFPEITDEDLEKMKKDKID